ncbi:SGNH/GDSL hydrolase family protein [Methylocapsa aurea]|uniref:SGNH/GDSL hydrolase family protein n=1 Tax=Methylocapsa aurea TaxID=663610 RepID=UPI0012EC9653|nr:SGNH/GDSL hydrolase family protein [Methylocapsa aurea]
MASTIKTSRNCYFVVCVFTLSFVNVAWPQTATDETFGAKLRRLAAAAEISNPLTEHPLRPASAWAPTRAYVQGEVVQNGQNIYLCYTSGTSAASGGPAGTGYSGIVDGTVVWFYNGPSVVNIPDPSAPTISATANFATLTSLGLTKSYNPVDSPSSFSFGGGVPTRQQNAKLVSFPAVHASANDTGGNIGFNNGTNNYYWSATFVTDAPIVAISVSFGGSPANIIIDGRRLFPGGYKGPSAQTAFILDFTRAGGRKSRTITLEDYGNIRFAGVTVDVGSIVSAPFASDRVRVAFLGSSIEAGGNGFPMLGMPHWPEGASKLLGWTDPWNLGLGGTGYIANAQGKSLNYMTHIADAISISPDIVVVGGPINDVNYPSSQLVTAAVSLLHRLRAALPKVPLLVMGAFSADRWPSTANLNSELAVKNAVQQLNDPNIFFIPLISGQDGSVISGTSRVTSPNGTGNSDFYLSSDGHPTQLGINHLSVQYATKIRSVFVNLLK